MKTRLIPCDTIPPRKTQKRPETPPEAHYRADGCRVRFSGYGAIIKEFQSGPHITARVAFTDAHPDTVYRGLLSACHDIPAPEITVIQRGTMVYLTRGTDTDRQARTERREAARAALLDFDSSGVHTARIECAPDAVAALYGLYQRQRTAAGLGYITVSRGAGGGIVLVNNMSAG